MIAIPQQTQPSRHQGFAHSQGESAHHDLWPVAGAYVPAFGPTGVTLRDVVNKKDGTLTNMSPGTDYVIGDDGYALHFDGGIQQYVTIPDLSSLWTTEATVVIWLRLNTNIPTESGETGAWNFGGASNSTHYPWTDENIYDETFLLTRINAGPSIVDMTQWHQYAVTTTPGAGGWNLYQNAMLVTTSTGDASATFHTTPLIGKSTGSFYLDGDIASVLFYDRVLTPNQLQHLYQDHLAPFRRKANYGLLSVPAAVGGLSIPVAMHHYTKNIGAVA